MKRNLQVFAVGVFSFSFAHARAEQLENIRPGLMCESEDALAKLSLPDGSSKLDRPGLHFDEVQLANQGRCVNAPWHIRVKLVSGRRNTSIVTFDNNDGRGPVTYYVANIAFKLAVGPSTCLPVDTQLKMRGKIVVIASKDRRNGSPYNYIVLHSETPYCIEPSLDGGLADPSRDVVVSSPADDPKQTAFYKLNGQTVIVSGRLSNDRNGGLLLFDSRLVP